MKRILLFVLTNVAVVAVLGIVASLLGVNRYLTANGLNLGALLGFALVMGFGGAIISLLISKPMAKWSAGVQIIEQPRTADEAWIVETVRKFEILPGELTVEGGELTPTMKLKRRVIRQKYAAEIEKLYA